MGGSSSSQIAGYWYHPAYHDGLGVGPIDAFLEFRAGDKTAWSGTLTASGTISINAPNLFGGEKDQGGIVGDVDIMFGEATQMPNAYLSATFGDQQPAWRGMTTLVFKGGKYGAMNPYPQEAAYKIRKIVKGWDDDACWYPEKAEVAVGDPSSNYWSSTDRTDAADVSMSVEGSGDVARYTRNVADGGDTSTKVAGIRSNLQRASGRYYFEIEFLGGDNLIATWGIREVSGDIADAVVSGSAGCSRGGDVFANDTSTTIGSFSPGDRVGIAVDLDTRKVWITRNGSWGHSTDPSNTSGIFGVTLPAGTYAPHFVAEATSNSADMTAKLHLRVDDFLYYPVGGWAAFQAWDDSAPSLSSVVAMNPAHILYYARTHSDLGRESTASIDETSYTDAADWFYSHGFGLCQTEYDPSAESVEEFEQRICRVAGCSVTRSLVDGKWYLDVANGIYDLESLPILTDDDILEFNEQPTLLDSAVNSVSIKYFDPARKETIVTPPTQAPALIDEYGTKHLTIEYLEIPTGALALRVALRELTSRITPLSGFQLKTTRKPYAWRPSTYFRLQVPKRGIADMVCIFGEKSSGQLRSGAMSITATQDVYSLPTTTFVETEPGVDTRPSQTPEVIALQRAFEAPYIDVVAALPRAELAVLPTDVGYLEAVAIDPAESIDFSMYVLPSGGEYEETASGNWCPSATLVEAATQQVTDFTLDDAYRLDEVTVGMPALLNDEIVRVDAIDADALTITLGRGCADTVQPSDGHAAGSRLWFWQAARAADTTEYTDGETVDVKLLTNTGSQQLDESQATAISVELASRQVRPYPPGLFRINTEAYPSYLFGELAVTWAHRDRVLQADQVIDTEEASIGPEAGTTYNVRYYLDDVLDDEETGITGASATPYTVSGSGVLRIELEAVRDGLTSWQMHSHECIYIVDPGAVRITTQGPRRTTTQGDVRITKGA